MNRVQPVGGCSLSPPPTFPSAPSSGWTSMEAYCCTPNSLRSLSVLPPMSLGECSGGVDGLAWKPASVRGVTASSSNGSILPSYCLCFKLQDTTSSGLSHQHWFMWADGMKFGARFYFVALRCRRWAAISFSSLLMSAISYGLVKRPWLLGPQRTRTGSPYSRRTRRSLIILETLRLLSVSVVGCSTKEEAIWEESRGGRLGGEALSGRNFLLALQYSVSPENDPLSSYSSVSRHSHYVDSLMLGQVQGLSYPSGTSGLKQSTSSFGSHTSSLSYMYCLISEKEGRSYGWQLVIWVSKQARSSPYILLTRWMYSPRRVASCLPEFYCPSCTNTAAQIRQRASTNTSDLRMSISSYPFSTSGEQSRPFMGESGSQAMALGSSTLTPYQPTNIWLGCRTPYPMLWLARYSSPRVSEQSTCQISSNAQCFCIYARQRMSCCRVWLPYLQTVVIQAAFQAWWQPRRQCMYWQERPWCCSRVYRMELRGVSGGRGRDLTRQVQSEGVVRTWEVEEGKAEQNERMRLRWSAWDIRVGCVLNNNVNMQGKVCSCWRWVELFLLPKLQRNIKQPCLLPIRLLLICPAMAINTALSRGSFPDIITPPN